VVFEKDIEVKGKIYASADQAGTAVIPANATSTEIVFSEEYEVTPKVVANLTGDDDNLFVGWKIIKKTAKGFTIVLQDPVNQKISFDWIALGVKDLASAKGAAPEITEFTASVDSVGTGTAVELWAKVTDADTPPEDLIYTWNFNPSLGGVTGNTGLVFWTVDDAVKKDTVVKVTVTVSDGINSVKATLAVTVVAEESGSKPSPKLEATEPPPPVEEEPTEDVQPTPAEEPTEEPTEVVEEEGSETEEVVIEKPDEVPEEVAQNPEEPEEDQTVDAATL
jgi:hypothetical protein